MTEPRTAELVWVGTRDAIVRCPFCGDNHAHPDIKPGEVEWRVPLCSMYLAPELRAAGYRFHVPARGGGAR